MAKFTVICLILWKPIRERIAFRVPWPSWNIFNCVGACLFAHYFPPTLKWLRLGQFAFSRKQSALILKSWWFLILAWKHYASTCPTKTTQPHITAIYQINTSFSERHSQWEMWSEVFLSKRGECLYPKNAFLHLRCEYKNSQLVILRFIPLSYSCASKYSQSTTWVSTFIWKHKHVYVCVCVCVCVCVHVYVVYEDTNLYNDMVWHRYYKENVIYEDIFSVPII